MTTIRSGLGLALLLLLLNVGCMQENPVASESDADLHATEFVDLQTADLGKANENACWGQASKVFAQMGEMGDHASQQASPRLGLRNVARALYADGILPDDSMQALGAFLSDALGLSIDACL